MAHRNHVDAVFCADIELPDGLAHPDLGNGDLHDAAVVRELDIVENARGTEPLRQLDAHFPLGNHHTVGAHLLERAFLHLVGRLAEDLGHAELLQVERHDHTGGQIRADGQHRTVVVAHAERAQHLFVARVTHDRIGHVVFNALHIFLRGIDRQNFIAEFIKLAGHRGAEFSKANDNIGFFHNNPLLSRSSAWCLRSGCVPPRGCSS